MDATDKKPRENSGGPMHHLNTLEMGRLSRRIHEAQIEAPAPA